MPYHGWDSVGWILSRNNCLTLTGEQRTAKAALLKYVLPV